MVSTPVTSWGEALLTSLATALALFLGAIPKIIGFLVILIIGWLIAAALAKAVAGLLRAVKFNDLAQKSGFTDFVHKMGVTTDAAGALATIAKWFVRLIVLVVAFDALGLPAVSQVLQQLLLWLPNLVVALVVLVIAGLAANALSSLVRGASAEAGLSNPEMLATVARVTILTFGIVVAVNQIGVARELVNTLFMGFVAALALALGLSFGLGGRDTAGEIVSTWYRRGQRAAPKLVDATDAAMRQAQAGEAAQSDGTTTNPARPGR
jgi:Mechanosensitive ion channel, conserved TM helix